MIPIIMVGIALGIQGVGINGERTVLASDGFHQYVIFHQTLRNTLHGDGSLFYTFTSGLGLNFYALISYYLGSMLSPFVYFFDLNSMPDALYLFTLLKFGLTGLSTYIAIGNIYKKLSYPLILLLSSSFSLISFTLSQLEINTWLDVFILIPLILLGLDRVINQKGRILYYVTLSLLFVQNYYFGFMTAIFIFLWYLTQLSWNFKERFKSIVDFIIVSLLSALTSMVMLLPTLLDLRNHGETLTDITKLQTENSWFLDLFAKNLVGSYDTTKYGAIPTIYLGLFPLLLAFLFFTLRSIKWQVKLSYLVLLLFIILSFYLQPLDLLWQGMHAPNMFLHRYAWVFPLVILFMAAETLSRLSEIRLHHILTAFSFLLIGYGATFLFRRQYSFLNQNLFIITGEFLIAYFIILLAFTKKKFSFLLFSSFSFFFVIFELGINTYFQVDGLANEWHFPTRKNYQENLQEIDTLVKSLDSPTSGFYRTERLQPQTGNDSMKFNYNGISQFSSIRNRSSSSTLDLLGFKSEGTNLNLRYQNNTLLADSLFGVHYNLSTAALNKFGFYLDKTQDSMNLYKNVNSGSLGILTDKPYTDIAFSNLFLENQAHFLNQLSGLNYSYFSTLSIQKIEGVSKPANTVFVNSSVNEDTASFTVSLTIPSNSQIYISLPNLTFSNQNSKQIELLLNDRLYSYNYDNSFPFFDAGYFEKSETVTITLRFPHNRSVSFDPPTLYRLNTLEYQDAFQKLNNQDIQTTVKGNQVTTHYQSDKKRSILYTIPFDKGWSARLNGTPVPITAAQTGFMKVDIPKGKGEVVLTFIPEGFKTGLLLSMSGIVLFVGYHLLRKKKSRLKRRNSQLDPPS
nr:YfhO family protein [Streptococcus sp. DD13]